MPIPDLCILERVITGYYKLMDVIITRVTRCTALQPASETRLTSSTISWPVSVVNTGGELPGLTLSNRGRSQAETLPLVLRKNRGAITLLQEGGLLTLAVLSKL